MSRYLLLTDVPRDAAPSDAILSAGDDLTSLIRAVSSVTAHGMPMIAFEGLARHARRAEIFDTVTLRVAGAFDAATRIWSFPNQDGQPGSPVPMAA